MLAFPLFLVKSHFRVSCSTFISQHFLPLSKPEIDHWTKPKSQLGPNKKALGPSHKKTSSPPTIPVCVSLRLTFGSNWPPGFQYSTHTKPHCAIPIALSDSFTLADFYSFSLSTVSAKKLSLRWRAIREACTLVSFPIVYFMGLLAPLKRHSRCVDANVWICTLQDVKMC